MTVTLEPPQTAATPPAGRPLPRRLLAPAAFAFAVQAVLAAADRLPSIDGVAYLEAGTNLVGGDGYVRAGHAELHFPPVVPTVLGLLASATDDLTAVRILDLVGGVALVAAIVAVAHRVGRDDRTTVLAAWLAPTAPGILLLTKSGGGGSEAPATALVLAAAMVAMGGRPRAPGEVSRAGPGRWLARGLAVGALVGVAYLTRPEALLPGLVVAAGLVLAARRRRPAATPPSAAPSTAHPDRWRAPLLAALGVVVALGAVAGPYVVWLHGQTGSWSPTSKSKEASIETWQALARDDRLGRDLELYALDPATGELAADPRPLAELARDDPGGWARVVGLNTASLGRHLVAPRLGVGPAWTMVALPLLVAACWRAWIGRRRPTTLLLVALALVPVAATTLAFFVLPRYLVLTTAVVVALSADGLIRAVDRSSPRAARVITWVTAALVATSFLSAALGLSVPRAYDPTEQASAGRWIAEHSAVDDRVMTRSYHVQYAAGRPGVVLPAGELDEVLAFARRNGVRFLVADAASIRGRRPDLAEPLLEQDDVPGLRRVHSFTERGRLVVIWELDPPAPPTDRPPLPLGYAGD